MTRTYIITLFGLLFSVQSMAGYNGISFGSGFPTELSGQCKVQAAGAYYLDDECLPPLQLSLHAVDSGGTEVSTNCGTYGKMKGDWQVAPGDSAPCELSVSASGSYQVYAEMLDHFGYRFRTEAKAVTVSCP